MQVGAKPVAVVIGRLFGKHLRWFVFPPAINCPNKPVWRGNAHWEIAHSPLNSDFAFLIWKVEISKLW